MAKDGTYVIPFSGKNTKNGKPQPGSVRVQCHPGAAARVIGRIKSGQSFTSEDDVMSFLGEVSQSLSTPKLARSHA